MNLQDTAEQFIQHLTAESTIHTIDLLVHLMMLQI